MNILQCTTTLIPIILLRCCIIWLLWCRIILLLKLFITIIEIKKNYFIPLS